MFAKFISKKFMLLSVSICKWNCFINLIFQMFIFHIQNYKFSILILYHVPLLRSSVQYCIKVVTANILALIPIFEGKVFSVSSLYLMLAHHRCHLSRWRNSFILKLLRNWYWIFSNAPFCIYWGNYMIFLLYSITMVKATLHC